MITCTFCTILFSYVYMCIFICGKQISLLWDNKGILILILMLNRLHCSSHKTVMIIMIMIKVAIIIIHKHYIQMTVDSLIDITRIWRPIHCYDFIVKVKSSHFRSGSSCLRVTWPISPLILGLSDVTVRLLRTLRGLCSPTSHCRKC